MCLINTTEHVAVKDFYVYKLFYTNRKLEYFPYAYHHNYPFTCSKYLAVKLEDYKVPAKFWYYGSSCELYHPDFKIQGYHAYLDYNHAKFEAASDGDFCIVQFTVHKNTIYWQGNTSYIYPYLHVIASPTLHSPMGILL